MDYVKEFQRIMEEQTEIALATSVNDIPNVRIVNFYYNPLKKGVLYFSSFKGNPKTKEFLKNDQVAFTTIPTTNHEHVRVQRAAIHKSALTIYDVKDAFIKKIPDYAMTIEQAGAMLDLYEIHFQKASVTLDMMKRGNITL